jgi:hypothetical protein
MLIYNLKKSVPEPLLSERAQTTIKQHVGFYCTYTTALASYIPYVLPVRNNVCSLRTGTIGSVWLPSTYIGGSRTSVLVLRRYLVSPRYLIRE